MFRFTRHWANIASKFAICMGISMKTKLIIDGNSFYEIDEVCYKNKSNNSPCNHWEINRKDPILNARKKQLYNENKYGL